MKTYQTCSPCIMKLFTSTQEKVTLPQDQKAEFLARFEAYWNKADMSLPPARTVGMIYQQVLQETGQKALFKAQKSRGIQEALLLRFQSAKKLLSTIPKSGLLIKTINIQPDMMSMASTIHLI